MPIHVLPREPRRPSGAAQVFRWPGQPMHRSSTALSTTPLADGQRLLPGEDRGELDYSPDRWARRRVRQLRRSNRICAMHHPRSGPGPAWDAMGCLTRRVRASLKSSRDMPKCSGSWRGMANAQMIVADLGSRPVLAIPSTYGQAKVGSGASKMVVGPSRFRGSAVSADGALASIVQFVAYR